MGATIVKAGARQPLNVLGMPPTLLCEASETSGNWPNSDWIEIRQAVQGGRAPKLDRDRTTSDRKWRRRRDSNPRYQ
jgi:hypothetical protein